MPEQTPGQIAYEAYARQRHHGTVLCPWANLRPELRVAWEAAAATVRMAYKEELAAAWQEGVLRCVPQEETPAPPFRFAVGQRVTWDDAPGAVWQISACWQDASVVNLGRIYALLPAMGDTAGFRPLHVAEADLDAVEEETP
jgi:hypothetical protein